MSGTAEVKRRPIVANKHELRKASGANQTSSLSNSIEVPSQSLIPALNLQDTKNFS